MDALIDNALPAFTVAIQHAIQNGGKFHLADVDGAVQAVLDHMEKITAPGEPDALTVAMRQSMELMRQAAIVDLIKSGQLIVPVPSQTP
jgi:hypothetical protein